MWISAPVRQPVQPPEVAGVATELSLRRHYGSLYAAYDFQREIALLGIESSPSLVRAQAGNGCAERIIRTLKEQLLWVRAFDTLEKLCLPLEEWRQLYDPRWLIEPHGHRSPVAVRCEYLATSESKAP